MTGSRQVAAAVLAVAALSAACAPGGQDQEVEFRVPVFVREVGTGTVEDRIVATGTLRSQESIALRADTAGSLLVARGASGRRLAQGDRVKSGQLIAEITGEEVRLTARTEATHERYETAKRDHDSMERLYQDGLLSEQEYHQIAATLAEAKIEWERSLLTETRSRLVTPISGVILRLARDSNGLPLADGQLVAQGFEVAQIAPVGPLIADVDLVGPDLSRVKVGQPVRIRHHAYEGTAFSGRVIRLAPSIDPVKRTLPVEVEVDNRDESLRPGMFVEATMISETREDVPVVPREAVAERGGRKVVFVVKGQRVNRREVALGLGDDEVVEIRQGLEPGERIVVRGLETLTDGTRVRVTGT